MFLHHFDVLCKLSVRVNLYSQMESIYSIHHFNIGYYKQKIENVFKIITGLTGQILVVIKSHD